MRSEVGCLRSAAAVSLFGLLACAGACTFGSIPTVAPPLADMDEPASLHEEPADEPDRVRLPPGSFTGIVAVESSAPATLDELAAGGADAGSDGLTVQTVVENSPADAAGIREGDILLSAAADTSAPKLLRHVSDWRAIELAAAPGTHLHLKLDRARAAITAEVSVISRVRPAGRAPVERFREEQKVGVVLRTATEVEARAAGLAPGAGAVVVGLSRASPWRRAGLGFGDLITEINAQPVSHPEVVLAAVRAAGSGSTLPLAYVRDGVTVQVDAPVSRRTGEATRAAVPPLFDYESDRGTSEFSLLLGLLKTTSTPAAWELRLLWIFRFGGGDSDKLEEIKVPQNRPGDIKP